MGERKVINKYYPPDFDPSKLPRARGPKDNQLKVRMMLPMSVRCNTCGEYLYKGKKFNARKETVNGEEYKGIRIFRFYMKCTACSAEFTIKTDPENSDYIADMNCSRNFDAKKDRDALIEQTKKDREAEEKGDAMKALENRTLDSKIEMDIIDALEEIKQHNAKLAKIDADTLLQHYHQAFLEQQEQLADDEEAEVQNIVFKSSEDYIKRVDDSQPVSLPEPEEDDVFGPSLPKKPKVDSTTPAAATTKISVLPIPKKPEVKKPAISVVPKIVVVKKDAKPAPAPQPKKEEAPAGGGLLGGLVAYDDDDE